MSLHLATKKRDTIAVMKRKKIDHTITTNKHKIKPLCKGLLKYHNVFNKSRNIFTFFISLKYHKLFEKSSIIFIIFLDHTFLFSSSVLPQLYKTLQMPFLLAIISKKCRPSLGSAILSHNFFI
jgi:hypothetical protein